MALRSIQTAALTRRPTAHLSKRAAATVLVVVGLLLASIHGIHVVAHDKPLLATVIGAGVPMILSLLLVSVGYWTARSDLSAAYASRLVQWVFVGAVGMGLLVGTIGAHQYLAGHLPSDAPFQLATAVTGGVLGGVLVGLYDVQMQRRSERIESLQRATSEFVDATDRDDVCELTVRLAASELEMTLAGVWLYDDDEHALEPVAVTDEGRALFDDVPTYEPGNSLSWQVFDDGVGRTYADLHDQLERYNPETVVRSEIILPLGDHGVLNVGSTTPNAFDEIDVSAARLLAAASSAILDRAEREAQLRAQQRELETQNDRLDEFASIVSHDLRNPLTIAQGYLEEAKTHPERSEQPLAEIDAALDRMEALIDDLLSLARAGQTIAETESVSLAGVATDAWQMIDDESAAMVIDDDVVFAADRSRLRQLFENLFRNAVEHGSTPRAVSGDGADGGDDAPPVSIRVGTLEREPGFYVADDGPGIPPEDRERVLSLGYTTNEDGTGIGLATVARIADAHEWTVSVTESAVGGARFEIRTA
ncbi:sensor histidine kinase [Natronolimnohabitans innermongolicus]|uniref:histidine kinase n=1 Tax=Natronolimnohabitans innermongolicus JCM 12255 TaxID=1227499 RepID=L9X5U5_9EURY|nr:GAF domain-containing sensor histidine kinase [Natronolimnohabitans innermongolicus]ELY55958.1 multi-sensor signal transduction histidine kinase [Natronolimnohabitans innermongolicus JCM 12255]